MAKKPKPKTKHTQQHEDDLKALLQWINERETGSSSDGFSTPVWWRDRPAEAILNLRFEFSSPQDDPPTD